MSLKVHPHSPAGNIAPNKGPGGMQDYAKFKASPGCEMLGKAIERLAETGHLEAALEPKAFELLGDALRRLEHEQKKL